MFSVQTVWFAVRDAVAREMRRRRMETELYAMTDYQLADIGVNRYEIADLARAAVKRPAKARRAPAAAGMAHAVRSA